MNFRKLSLILCLFMIPSIGLARGEHRKQWKKMMEQLELSDDQKEELREIRKSSKDSHKALKKTIKEKRKTLETLLREDAAEADIRTAHQELQALKQVKVNQRFEKMMSIREILNAEQRKKFHELRPKRKGKHGHDRR